MRFTASVFVAVNIHSAVASWGDCSAGDARCAAVFGGSSYCKYWQDRPVCQGTEVACACDGSAPELPTSPVSRSPRSSLGDAPVRRMRRVVPVNQRVSSHFVQEEAPHRIERQLFADSNPGSTLSDHHAGANAGDDGQPTETTTTTTYSTTTTTTQPTTSRRRRVFPTRIVAAGSPESVSSGSVENAHVSLEPNRVERELFAEPRPVSDVARQLFPDQAEETIPRMPVESIAPRIRHVFPPRSAVVGPHPTGGFAHSMSPAHIARGTHAPPVYENITRLIEEIRSLPVASNEETTNARASLIDAIIRRNSLYNMDGLFDSQHSVSLVDLNESGAFILKNFIERSTHVETTSCNSLRSLCMILINFVSMYHSNTPIVQMQEFVESRKYDIGSVLIASSPMFSSNWLAQFPVLFEHGTSPRLNALKLAILTARINRYKRTQNIPSNLGGTIWRVRRSDALADSVSQLNAPVGSREFLNMYAPIADVRFLGIQTNSYGELVEEMGHGQGLTRQWYDEVARGFVGSVLESNMGDSRYIMISPLAAAIEPNNLQYFRALGRFMAFSLIHQRPVGLNFPKFFYQRFLDGKVELDDIRHDEKVLHRFLTPLKQASPEVLASYGVAIPDSGFEENVDEHNRDDQIRGRLERLIPIETMAQFNATRAGFNDLLPIETILGSLASPTSSTNAFTASDLALFVYGEPEMDLDDMEANTVMPFDFPVTLRNMLFNVLRGFPDETRRRFLAWVTGSSQSPFGGFANLRPQKFNLFFSHASTDHLPEAHTCFNRIDLPNYVSAEQMREKLLIAIDHFENGLA